MGALTSNRKRGDGCFSLNHQSSPYQNTPDFQISKKPKISLPSMHQSADKPVISSNSTASRLSRYPETKPTFRREIHAPVRTLKFGFSTKSKTSGFSENMGNLLSIKYDYCKRNAFNVLRYFGKDKEVIDIDNGRDTEEVISVDDSSVEEVEIIEFDGREKRRIDDLGLKIVEEQNFQPSSSSVVTEVNNGGNLRGENAGKTLDSYSLARGEEGVISVEVYKQLLASAERRDSKLKGLDYQIEFNEKKLASLQLLKKPVEKLVEEAPREPFVPLTKEEEEEVERAFAARGKVLVSHKNSGIDITGQLLLCLRPGAWLNDEVINVYLELLKEREIREPQKFLKCHFFNTFFYNKLKGGGFRAVKRWTSTKKLGYSLIECDKIFVPIHKEIHWCLAIINMKDQKFQYLDSLKGKDHAVLKSLAAYLEEEVKDKSGKVIDVSSWEKEFVEDLPEQENGFDCGMFMLKYVDFHSRGLGFSFNQEHMPYFRVRTAKEILRLRAD